MSDPTDLYKIGTVAKLTGIAVERLRAWERRYGLTPASREGKIRYFSAEQIERLTRIKRLIDQGHPVSTLINLDSDALNERLHEIGGNDTGAHTQHAPTIGLVGTQLLMLEQMLTEPPRVNISSRWVNLPLALAALQDSAPQDTPDVIVALVGSLSVDSLAELDDLPAKTQPIVIYHYATDAGLEDGSNRDWDLLRWPVSWADIEQVIARRAKQPLNAGFLAARRFSDEQLLSIASTGSGLGCACPADLVNLISALNAFADHSNACAAQPETHRAAPARAAASVNGLTFDGSAGPSAPEQRHLQIAERTSQARLELELVLEDWVTSEGLLPVPN